MCLWEYLAIQWSTYLAIGQSTYSARGSEYGIYVQCFTQSSPKEEDL